MKWTESFVFSRHVRLLTQQCRPFWFYMLIFGGGLFSLLGIAGVVGYLLHGAPELWPVLWIGLGLGLLLGITTYLGSEWIPAVIRLNDKGIERQVLRGIHVHLERWKWTDIAHCCFERTKAAGRDFDILAVYSPTGQAVPLGLHRKVTREKLQEWFEIQNHPFPATPRAEYTPLANYIGNPFLPSLPEATSLGG